MTTLISNRAIAALTLGAWLAASLASAADDEPLARYLSDPVEQQHVVSAAQRSTVILQNPCPAAQFTIEPRFVIYKQPTFDSGGVLGDGSWKQVVDAEGCGIRRVLNVMVSAQGPHTAGYIPLLPGTTHATPLLQRDAVTQAVAAIGMVAGGREPNCNIGYVADTQFLETESTSLPGAKGPSWRELWTVASCTQTMAVPMRFIPDATGTSIAAGPNTAVKITPFTIPAAPAGGQ